MTIEFQNFAHSSLNYPITQNNYKYRRQIFEQLEINPKFAQVKIGLKKILSQEEFFFYKRDILSKDPEKAKKMV